MSKRKLAALVCAAMVSSVFVPGTSARADTLIVEPGESIQAAINAASAGDTIVVKPGVYQEYLSITKNNIHLRGSGAAEDGTVLEPPAVPNAIAARCEDPEPFAGICIMGRFTDRGPRPVRNAKVTGFLIRNFPAFGIFALATHRTVMAHNEAQDNAEYGFASFVGTKSRMAHSRSSGAQVAGFYVGESPDSGAVVKGNISTGNREFGFFLRDTSVARAVDNTARDNCIGFMVMDSGAPGKSKHWKLKRNNASRNNEFCPPSGPEGAPPFSGTGFALLGLKRSVVKDNRVWNNQPSGEVLFSGGIVLASAKDLGGANPRGNRIVDNVAYNNAPADLVWDESGRNNRFAGNDCGVSLPGGMC